MFAESSAMEEAQQCATGSADPHCYSEWFQSWDTIEVLARGASALHQKCGGNCSIAELQEWRERILAQIQDALADEKRIFGELAQQG